MKSFDADTLDRLDAGEIDYLDAASFIFDSGIANMFFRGVGKIEWTDETLGSQVFYGGGALLELDLPGNSLANDVAQITIKLNETYLVEGDDEPRNIWDDGESPTLRETIDQEPWQGREVILSVFWLDADGNIIEREQVERRQMDSMVLERDSKGNPVRNVVLERPDIIQRDIEGKTDNAEFQKQIDAADLGYEHVGSTATQKIFFGKVQDETVA